MTRERSSLQVLHLKSTIKHFNSQQLNMNKDIVLSGIRPTGNLHLGNYYGAVRSFVKMQEDYNCYFFIADWHSLTTHPTPENIQKSARTILAEYLACGIDPEKATIYIQSDVPETIELYLYFNMNAYIGELGRVTTFKEKARQQPDNVNRSEEHTSELQSPSSISYAVF